MTAVYTDNMKESHTRSIIKGLTWRCIATLTTMLVVYLMTGNLALVASVGMLDVVIKLFFYYLHERTWGKVSWGVNVGEATIESVVVRDQEEKRALPSYF